MKTYAPPLPTPYVYGSEAHLLFFDMFTLFFIFLIFKSIALIYFPNHLSDTSVSFDRMSFQNQIKTRSFFFFFTFLVKEFLFFSGLGDTFGSRFMTKHGIILNGIAKNDDDDYELRGRRRPITSFTPLIAFDSNNVSTLVWGGAICLLDPARVGGWIHIRVGRLKFPTASRTFFYLESAQIFSLKG